MLDEFYAGHIVTLYPLIMRCNVARIVDTVSHKCSRGKQEKETLVSDLKSKLREVESQRDDLQKVVERKTAELEASTENLCSGEVFIE